MFDNLKITNEMTATDIENLLELDGEEYQKEIEHLVESIKDNQNKIEVFEKIQKECENTSLIKIVYNSISAELKPFEETQFLREVEYEKFTLIINYLFENTILQTELRDKIRSETGLNKDNLGNAIKLLNTLTEWIVVKRYSFSYFKKAIYTLFRFDAIRTEFLWNLYMNNKQELRTIVLLNNTLLCEDINESFSKLMDIFNDIFDDDES